MLLDTRDAETSDRGEDGGKKRKRADKDRNE